MNESEVRTEGVTSETLEQAPAKSNVSKKSQTKRKRKQVKRRTKSTVSGVTTMKRSAIRLHLRQGKTEAETVLAVGETLETVRREAKLFWEELSRELLADPTISQVQAVMRALSVYTGSQEAISALARDQNAKPSDKVKYMELALDANKEIVRYQSMEMPAMDKSWEAGNDERTEDERPTREQLDTAIALLTERIGSLRTTRVAENKADTGH